MAYVTPQADFNPMYSVASNTNLVTAEPWPAISTNISSLLTPMYSVSTNINLVDNLPIPITAVAQSNISLAWSTASKLNTVDIVLLNNITTIPEPDLLTIIIPLKVEGFPI